METFIVQTVAPALLQYIVELSISFVSEAALAVYQAKAQEKLAHAKNLKDVELFHSMDAFTAELISVSDSVIQQTKETLKLGEQHAPLLRLFEDYKFLNELAKWLVLGQHGEGEQARKSLETRMIATLRGCGTKPELVTEFEKTFFALIERDIARNPTLAHWRQEALLKILSCKLFTPEQLQHALIRYRDLTLKFCDILDLAGLPEDDRHLATQKFVLRNFYVPLRVRVEPRALTEEDLIKLELRRESERLQAAGREKGEQENLDRVAVGERLQQNSHFVVLGDPGAGKTTLIRWLVTAYLLKMKQDVDFGQLPDVKTLPDRDWLPILIRCRELDTDSLRGGLDDMLRQTLKKAELVDDTELLLVALKQQLQTGQALLLIDGLDEIADPTVRIKFCQQLETLAKRYFKATILITSRIVGYREMPFKMGRSFEHLIVTDLSKEDKDEFARRWCETTELKDRCAQATADLIKAIHSSDRIERLSGNPMLLTTLALVKRKVGKLSTRRADLYYEAIKVLLNWRAEVDEPLDEREALPQLEYVAYEMCRRGEQRLREDEIIALLEEVRVNYANIRPLHKHGAEDFLKILQRRTSILIEVGTVKHDGLLVPVYEFRRIVFQEYLAGLALVRGHFPGHDKTKRLAERIAPLAGQLEEIEGEFAISENWREALSLCIASCNDDDVDEAIQAILMPLDTEDIEKTAHPRAALAALCLADEPNVSEEVGIRVLQTFVQQMKQDFQGKIPPLQEAIIESLDNSVWQQKLQEIFSSDESILPEQFEKSFIISNKPAIHELVISRLLSFGSPMSIKLNSGLNVLIGTNGSGKSNLIEVFSLLQAMSKNLLSTIINGGGIREWLWKGVVQSEAELQIVVVYPPLTLRHVICFREIEQHFEITNESIKNGLQSEIYTFQYGKLPILTVHKNPLMTSQRELPITDIDLQQSILVQRKDSYLYPEIAKLSHIYNSIRIYRDWQFGRKSEVRLPQPADLPNLHLEENLTNLSLILNRLCQTYQIKQRLLEILQELYGEIEDFTLQIEGGTVQIFFQETFLNTPIPATRLSDGTLRFLCLLVILLDPEPPPLICIEEPELGLHPDVLPTLAKLLKEAGTRTQLIITTHSADLIDELSDTPEAVFVCEKFDGATQIGQLDVNELSIWLEDYRLGQLWRRGDIGGNRW